MASIFKTLRAQGRQRLADSPFDSNVHIKNYEEIEVREKQPEVENRRRKRRSTIDTGKMFKRFSHVTQSRGRDNEVLSKEKKDEGEELSEEGIEDLPCYTDDGEIVEIDVEWANQFPRKQDRFSFYWWGDQVEVPEPFPPAATLEIKQIALGGRHFVALTSLGQVYTWGNGSSGQLGHGNTESINTPKLIESLKSTRIRKIASLAAQSAALANNGELYSWGWTGSSCVTIEPSVVKELKGWNILQVVLGAYHTTVLATGDADKANEVFSWGRGSKGQLGHGDLTELLTPTSIERLKNENVVALASGETHTCCATSEGKVFAWGANENGSLGVASSENIVNTPMLVTGLDNVRVTKLSCGLSFSAALSAAGAVYTWGRNQHGQLGIGTSEEIISSPKQVKILSNVSIEGIICSNNHMLAWTDKNKTFTWGSTRNFRLGCATDKNSFSVPKIVEGLNGLSVCGATCASRVVIVSTGEKMFGKSLASCISEGRRVPPVVEECFDYLRTAVGEEGLFRISPGVSEKEHMITWWNEGYRVNLSNSPSPHLVASLLKHFLLMLPEPLMTFDLFDDFITLGTETTDLLQKLEGLRCLLRKLPDENRNLLEDLLQLLANVHYNREASKMDCKNLANIFAPAIFRPPEGCIEETKNVLIEIKLTKKMIKYFSAMFCTNSSSMLTSIGDTIIDKKATKEEIQQQQKKIFHACVRSLNDPTAAFVTTTQTSGPFSQILFESEMINYAIQSAILHYPAADSLILLEQLLSLLSNIPISTLTNLIDGLSFIKLPEAERSCIGSILSAHKDISNFGDTESSGIDWSNVTLTEFPIEDEEFREQLQETERAALLLRQAEQDRQVVSCSSSPAASLTKIPITSIFAFMDKQRTEYQQKLEEMKINKTNAERGEITIDPQQERLKQGLDSLQQEKKLLLAKLKENTEKLVTVEEDLTRHTKESSIEQQRYRDELEGLDSNIELKEEALQVSEKTAEKINQFLDGPFASNNNRLMSMKDDLIKTILENTGECPVLIYRYLDANLHVLSELRKKMKRARKDVKRIGRSYGEEAAAAIQSEYRKLREIFAEVTNEMEEAAAVYHPILQPVLDWMEFCKEQGVDPSTGALLDDYITSSLVNTTSIMREFLLVLLRGFGIFADSSNSSGSVKKIKLVDIIAKQESIEENVQAIKRRHRTE